MFRVSGRSPLAAAELGEASAREAASLAERIVEVHGAELLRVSRRYSRCAADAEDAYQRSLEILLTKAPSSDEQRIRAWLLSVVRNEALMIQRKGKRLVSRSFEDVAEEWPAELPGPEEMTVDGERLRQGREALRRIKPDQMRCLLLRADGMDYDEICARTGFSYAKVNRCLSEGRKALRGRIGMIDSGTECRRLLPVLSMIADNAADQAAIDDASLHLAGCVSCKRALAEFRAAPSELAALFPVGLVAAGTSGVFTGRVGELIHSLAATLQERVLGHVAVQQGSEIAFAKKVVAVTAVAAALTAGGATVGLLGSTDGDAQPGGAMAVPGASAITGSSGAPSGPAGDDSGVRDGTKDKTQRTARDARQSDVVNPHAHRADVQDEPSTPAQSDYFQGDTEIAPPPESDPVDLIAPAELPASDPGIGSAP